MSAARTPQALHAAVRASVPLSACAALLTGWLFLNHRSLVVLTAALLATLPLLFSPVARVAFVVFGGLLVFHSAAELTPPKLLFLFGVAVSVAGALARAQHFKRDPAHRAVAPLFAASRAFLVLILVSLPVSMAHQTPHKEWLRDAAPYLLFAVMPLLAYDAKTGLSERALRRLLLVAGLAGTIAFVAQWLSSRGIANVSVFGLPTIMLGAALFAYAIAVVLEGDRQRLRWLVLASAILAGLLTTGTRSAVIVLAAPIAIVLGARRHFARRSVRLAIVLPAAVLLIALGVQSVLRTTGAKRDKLDSRVQLLFHTGGSTDQSYAARLAVTRASWKVFRQSPLLGAGPGYPISWEDSNGVQTSATSVDSAVSYLAKFGLLGLWPLAVLAWSLRRVLRLLREQTGERTIGQLALIGFAAVFVAWSVLQVPFEDKGLASGFLLLLALALSESSAASRRAR
jgi:O-antigen ligase